MTPQEAESAQLVARLRDLSLVEIDALAAGTSGAERARLLAAYAGDLGDALARAGALAARLLGEIHGGTDPLSVIRAAPAVRARDGGAAAIARTRERLAVRAAACRELAHLDELCARLVPRLVEVDRQRVALGL